jgi:hypothetical protein
MSDDETRASEDAHGIGHSAYERLDQCTRLVAIWHVAGFTIPEIAAHLGLAPTEVATKLEHIREIVRASVDHDC